MCSEEDMPYLPPFLLLLAADLRYRRCVTNRDQCPDVSLDTWREVYGAELDECEQRYVRGYSHEEKNEPLPACNVNVMEDRRYRSYASNRDEFRHVSTETWRQI